MHPLPATAFSAVLPVLCSIPINQLFARQALKPGTGGLVWADSLDSPQLYHIIHPCGMSLLFGDATRMSAEVLGRHLDDIRHPHQDRWMQVAPGISNDLLNDALGHVRHPGIHHYQRSNFSFDPTRFATLDTPAIPEPLQLYRLTRSDFVFPELKVSPHLFWRDADELLAHGGGWCIKSDDEILALAFTAFRQAHELEIGIETRAAYRGRGLAMLVAQAMITDCLSQRLTPLWSCNKANMGSYRLAEKLGFIPGIELPYYHLPATPAAGM